MKRGQMSNEIDDRLDLSDQGNESLQAQVDYFLSDLSDEVDDDTAEHVEEVR